MIAKIEKIECGSTMDGYGNTCFFNSLNEFLKGRNGILKSYKELLEMGGWDFENKKGKMVDTQVDQDEIECLANSLKIRIAIYMEVEKGVVETESLNIFGRRDYPVGARIVRLKGFAHFNALVGFVDFHPYDVETEASRRWIILKHEIEQDRIMEAEKASRLLREENRKRVAVDPSGDVKSEMKAAIADADKRKKAAEAEMKILELTMKVSELEKEIIEWGHTLTALGRDPEVEKRIAEMCHRFKVAMETRETLSSILIR